MNINKNTTSPLKKSSNKKVSLSKLIKLATTAALAGELFFATPTFSQEKKTNTLPQHTTKTLTTTTNKTKVSKTIIPIDSLDHEKVIHMSVIDILDLYGEEKGLEIINKHMVIAINKIRDSLQVPPLSYSYELSVFSQKQAEFLENAGKNITGQKIYHTEGEDVLYKRLKRENIPNSYCGENLAQGQITIDKVIKDWLTSPAHRYNIVCKNYKKLGVGYKNPIRVYTIIG